MFGPPPGWWFMVVERRGGTGAQMIGSSGVKHVEQRCRCASCDRDVRRNISAAHAALKWSRVKSMRSGLHKMKLTDFRVVCSQICAHRLKRDGGWEFQPLSCWLGPSAYTQYTHLVADFWITKDLKHMDLPVLLYALTREPRPTVMKIRPEVRAIISEAKEVLSQ